MVAATLNDYWVPYLPTALLEYSTALFSVQLFLPPFNLSTSLEILYLSGVLYTPLFP